MENERPKRLSNALLLLGLAGVVAVAILRAPYAEWNLALFGILLAFSAFSDITSIETESHLKISGNFLALVLAMVLLGGAPAATIGLISILFGWLRFREGLQDLLVNSLTFTTFPLVVGIGFHELVDANQITPSDLSFYVLVFCAFLAALAINRGDASRIRSGELCRMRAGSASTASSGLQQRSSRRAVPIDSSIRERLDLQPYRLIAPVLSPSLSVVTASLSSIATRRFAIGVFFG